MMMKHWHNQETPRSVTMRQLAHLAAVGLLVVIWVMSVACNGTSSSCPVECRCLDHESIINCHHADIDRLPSPLPPSAIVLDADRNRIPALYNDSLCVSHSSYSSRLRCRFYTCISISLRFLYLLFAMSSTVFLSMFLFLSCCLVFSSSFSCVLW